MDRPRGFFDSIRASGLIVATLIGPDGQVKQVEEIHNLITRVGDQMYAERAVGLGSLNAPTGMQLGTGTTAVAKTGAGAAMVTYISGSNQAMEGGYPASSLNGTERRIHYRAIWAAGDATNSAIAECVLTIVTANPDAASAEAGTAARGLFASTIDKQAADTLQVDWYHDFEAA